jgi:hypothetical protein
MSSVVPERTTKIHVGLEKTDEGRGRQEEGTEKIGRGRAGDRKRKRVVFYRLVFPILLSLPLSSLLPPSLPESTPPTT